MIAQLLIASTVLAAGEAVTNPLFVGGAVSASVALISLLVRELRRSGDGAWRVVQNLRGDLHRARYDLAVERYERGAAETQLRICRGLAPEGTLPDIVHPGPYVEPTDKELKSWL